MDVNLLNKNDIDLAISLTNAPTKFDKYLVLLKKDFGYNLTKSEFATVIKKSEQTIDRRIKDGMNIPPYQRTSEGSKASYIFPVAEVAEYLCNTIEVA